MDFEVVKRLIAALEREQVRYAIFGAVAMSLHGIARFTEDGDIFVEPEATNISRLRAALRSVVDDPEIEQITAADLLGGTFHIDIVTRLGDALTFADLETERLPFDGLTVSVVTPRGLYTMKRNTGRLKDRADAEALKERFGIVDEKES